MYELATGKLPFSGTNQRELLLDIVLNLGQALGPNGRWDARQSQLWATMSARGIPEAFIELVLACLHPEPTLRPTANQALDFDFF